MTTITHPKEIVNNVTITIAWPGTKMFKIPVLLLIVKFFTDYLSSVNSYVDSVDTWHCCPQTCIMLLNMMLCQNVQEKFLSDSVMSSSRLTNFLTVIVAFQLGCKRPYQMFTLLIARTIHQLKALCLLVTAKIKHKGVVSS